MIKFPAAAALLAFGTLAVLPACSMNSSRTSSAAPMSTNPELSPGMVRQVQTTLQQQGLYTGNIDGLWGPATQSAVVSFQRANSLRPTGELNSPTLAALNMPNNAAAPATAPPPSDATSSAVPAPTDNSTTTAPATQVVAAPMPAVAATSTAPVAPPPQ